MGRKSACEPKEQTECSYQRINLVAKKQTYTCTHSRQLAGGLTVGSAIYYI